MTTRRTFVGGLLAAISAPFPKVRADRRVIHSIDVGVIKGGDESVRKYIDRYRTQHARQRTVYPGVATVDEKNMRDAHLRMLGALVKPTLGFDAVPSGQTAMVELMRRTRPECRPFEIITDEAIQLYLQVEEMEAEMIHRRLHQTMKEDAEFLSDPKCKPDRRRVEVSAADGSRLYRWLDVGSSSKGA